MNYKLVNHVKLVMLHNTNLTKQTVLEYSVVSNKRTVAPGLLLSSLSSSSSSSTIIIIFRNKVGDVALNVISAVFPMKLFCDELCVA